MFGAEDMIGNASEWVAGWSAGFFSATKGDGTPLLTSTNDWRAWPDGFADDGTHDFDSVSLWDGSLQPGLPAPLLRGGRFVDGKYAGAFTLNANLSAAAFSAEITGRCLAG